MSKCLLVAIAFLLVSVNASAEFVGPGSKSTLTDVSSVLTMQEDTQVSLVGYLINRIDKEYYTFQDDSGQMVIEIHRDELREIDVTPKNKIKIIGEVDHGKHDAKVDVDHIIVLN